LESQSQPPESQPATTPAGPSLTRCSTGRSTTSTTLESDSEDGSDLDENDDAWEDDVEEEQVDEDNDDCENDDNDNGSAHVPLSLAAMLDDLQWKFEEVPFGTNHTPKQTFYEGTSCLRRGVAQSLTTPFECLGVCGGLSVAFVKRLAAESNDYFHHALKKNLSRNNMFHGVKWVNITTAEMFHFLGILLRISMEERDGGGYRAYFRTDDKVLHTSTVPMESHNRLRGQKVGRGGTRAFVIKSSSS
jgi:hypothetical protein